MFKLQRKTIPRFCGVFSASVGLLVLLGWMIDNAFLKSISPTWVPMLPNTSVGLTMCGIALFLGALEGKFFARLSRLPALFVLAMAGLTLAEYFFSFNFGIDDFLFKEKLAGIETSYPGRMAPVTLPILILAALALILPDQNERWINSSQWMAAIAAFISTQVLLGYLYQTDAFFATTSLARTAIHTAGTSLILSIGIFLRNPAVGLAKFATSESSGGKLLRRLWLLTLSILFLFGWLTNKGDEMAWFRSDFGTGLLIMATSAVITVVIWRNAHQIDGLELKRRDAENLLRESERQLQRIFKSVTVGIGQCDLTGKFIFTNDCFCKIVGRSKDELLQLSIHQITHPDDLQRTLELNGQLVIGGKDFVYEKRYLRPDGSVVWVRVDASLLRDQFGKPESLVAVISDLTEQKLAENMVEQQQTELSEFFENAPFGLDWLAPDGVILRANQTELQMLGYERSEFVGHEISEFFDNRVLADDFLRRSRQSAVRDYEAQLRAKDGSVRHVLINSDLKREDRRGVQIRCSVQDITERRRAEDQLRTRIQQQEVLAKLGDYAAAEDDLQTFMDFATGLVAQTLQVEFCKILKLQPDRQNLTLESGVGWKEGLVGRETVSNDSNSQAGYTLLVKEPVAVSDLRTESRFHAPRILLEHGIVSGMSTSIPGDEGIPYGILGAHSKELRFFNRDDLNFLQGAAHLVGYAIHANHERLLQQRATELTGYSALLEKRVAERTVELQKSVSFLETFLYAMAHDLRAPLRAMSGFTTALMEGYSDCLDDVGKNYAQRIHHAATRMDQLVTDLLNFGRLTHISLLKAPVDLDVVLDQALEELDLVIIEKKAQLQIRKPLGRVWGNNAMLHLVFVNLISNSLKFVAKGVQPKIQISSTIDSKTKMIRILVKDNGIGIDPQFESKIFGAFQRLHTEEFPGTGMGLAIAQTVVDRLSGRIGFSSEPGKGTCFWFELPLAEQTLKIN